MSPGNGSSLPWVAAGTAGSILLTLLMAIPPRRLCHRMTQLLLLGLQKPLTTKTRYPNPPSTQRPAPPPRFTTSSFDMSEFLRDTWRLGG